MAMEPERAKAGFMVNQQEIAGSLLRYWTDFAHWTRAMYISTMYGLNNREPVQGRLLKNAGDFTVFLQTYYGDEVGRKFELIITDIYHSLFAMSDALHRHDTEAADALNTAMYNRLDDMVALLKSINSGLDEETFRKGFYDVLYLALEEAVMIYADEYEQSVRHSDEIINLASKIAEEFAYEMVSQLQCETNT